MRERIRDGAAIAIGGLCVALGFVALLARKPAPISEKSLGLPPSGVVFVIGLGLMIGIAAWVGRGQAGETLRPLAIPLATATSTFLLLAPLGFTTQTPAGLISELVLPPVALLILADGFVVRIPNRAPRRLAVAASVLAAVGTTVVWIRAIAANRTDGSPMVSPWIWLELMCLLAITLGPALILLGSRQGAEVHAAAARGARSSDRLPILLAAVAPVFVSSSYGYDHLELGLTIPMILLLVAVVALQSQARFDTLRTQRDMVVAATEVERARLAADLHDDALQEMTILVRRLDRAGDTHSAELARSIADRLREVCGDLRLPILDELGAGPALEWLVARVGETSGRLVRLEREDASRPPADVELAVFRVAQEALSNAVTHGAPPILVRYDAATNRATLSITDRGTGIPPDAATIANRSGHYGLLNMRQRAEQIGATFEVRQPADGGTTIGLSWSSA